MSEKMNNRLVRSSMAFIMAMALIVTGIFAFLTSNDNKINVFTVGNVDVELHEDNWYSDTGKVKDDENKNGIPDWAEDVVPGQEIIKAPYVENTGRNNAHIFLVVAMPVEKAENIYTGNGTYEGKEVNKIIVTTYALQENYGEENEDSEKMWNTYLYANDIKSVTAKPATDTDRVEVFELLNLNTEDWIHMDILSDYTPNAENVTTSYMYPAANGYNYYFFKYNNENNNAILNVGDETSPLFTAVTPIVGIGEAPVAP